MKYGLINNSDKAAIEMALREVDAEFPSQVVEKNGSIHISNVAIKK
jgi:hypothetical protein